MSIHAPPISYDDFQLLGDTSDAGEYWGYSNGNCSVLSSLVNSLSGCGGYCLYCNGLAVVPNTGGVAATFMANISVNSSLFRNEDTLTFVWRYWPSLFITGRDGAPLPHPGLTSQVGIIGFADLCNYTNGNWFEWDPANKAVHHVIISASASGGPNIYVPISINIYIPNTDPGIYSYEFKGISFKTLTDDAVAQSQSQTPSPSSQSPSPFPLSQDPSPSPNAGVIAGAIVGCVAFVTLMLALVLFYRRSKQRRLLASDKSPHLVPYSTPLSPSGKRDPVQVSHLTKRAFSTYLDAAVVLPPETVPREATPNAHPSLDEEGQRTLPSPGGTSTVGNIRPILAASSTAGGSAYEPPPAYGNSIVLATWASANRNVISEDTETKLLAAGYMPGDDPDIFSEDEWQTRYGLTRLELFRLRNLYARDAGTAIVGGGTAS